LFNEKGGRRGDEVMIVSVSRCGVISFVFEEDALLVVFAINNSLIFSPWNFTSFLFDINLILSFFL